MTEAQRPTVSVVITTHNRPELLRKAIESVLDHQTVDLEIIVVDDGSNPPAVLAPEDSDRGVRLLRQPISIGVCAARNRGIAEAHGQYVAFLDDDDRWIPTKLARQLEVMHRDGRRWSVTGIDHVDSSGRPVQPFYPELLTTAVRDIAIDNRLGPPSAVLAERSLLVEAGGFAPSLSVIADWELWIRLVAIDHPAIIPEPMVLYLEHQSAMHLTNLKTTIRERGMLARKFGRGHRLGGVGFWLWIASSLHETKRPVLATIAYLHVGLRFPRGSARRARARRAALRAH